MEKEGGLVRFRVVFDDCGLLSKSQISDGFSRCWLLLKPGIATFADLASHLRKTFAFRERLVLYIDDFVLPPFESTRIIKDNDIIRPPLAAFGNLTFSSTLKLILAVMGAYLG